MGDEKLWSGNMKGRDHLEDLSIDGRLILKLILKRLDVRVQTGFIRFGRDLLLGCWVHSNGRELRFSL
jgi:hypothetical protein